MPRRLASTVAPLALRRAEPQFPTRPPLKTWLADGKIRAVVYTDDDGAPRGQMLRALKRAGFVEARTSASGATLLKSAGDKDRAPMEIVLQPAPREGRPPSIYSKVGAKGIDVILYAGHAQYAKGPDHARAAGVGGSGKATLAILLQCFGEAEIEPIKAAFPELQLISSRDIAENPQDYAMLPHILDGLRRGEPYAQTKRRAVQAAIASQAKNKDYRGYDFEKYLFFPHERAVLKARMDRDLDGVPDARDPRFDCKPPPGASSVTKAASAVNQVLFYAYYPKQVKQGAPWTSFMFEPAGVFEPKPGDTRAFELERAGGVIRVRLSARFANESPQMLARMLAWEAGQFVGAGLAPHLRTALALSFLERTVFQEVPAPGPQPDAEREWVRLLDHYRLPKLSPEQLFRASGSASEDHLEEKQFMRLAKWVKERPEWASK